MEKKKKQFVIYLGTQDAVTIADEKLSKTYKLLKGVPVLVENDNDKKILTSWTEKQHACCGQYQTVRPIYDDITYCFITRQDITEFRNSWIIKQT